MNHKRPLLAVLIFAGLLTACGGATTSTPTAASAATSAPTLAPTDTPSQSPTEEPTAVSASEGATPTAASEEATPTAQPEPSAEASTSAKLNLNDVTADELLATIPGFSNRMVREFQEYRPYVSILQFRREIGKYVDEAQVAEWEKYVYVPVDVDESDAETLKQLPGVDDAIAEALISARPYGSNDAFLAKLAEYASAADVTNAAAYLQSN